LLTTYGSDPEFDLLLEDKINANVLHTLKSLSALSNSEETNLVGILNVLVKSITEYPGNITDINIPEQKNIISLLTDLLHKPNEEIRYQVQELLFIIDPACLIICSDLLKNDGNIWNRARYLDLLATFDISQTVEIIESMTSDTENMVKERADEILKMYKAVK
jgi:hypothetical protein